MTKPFTHFLRVRYAECDPQNVVFNAKYGEYADIAATEFTRLVWGDYANVLAKGVDNQVVNLSINWQASAVFDDVLAIEVTIGKIGNTSYSLLMSVKKYHPGSKDRTSIADISLTYVVVDTQNYKKTSIPDFIRGALEKDYSGQVSNHAGIELESA